MKNKKLQYLKECSEFIPACSQTLSKNPTQYVVGVTPVAIKRGRGVYLWDIEGKKYLDMVLALGPVIFGYANPRIDKIVKKQIGQGTIFSLPSAKELELAKLLRQVVPCAEMSRFLLGGNEATSGAIRLARHVTKRDHVAKCGYHGFQDWSICSKVGRNAGVPELLKTLTHDFVYNDTESLEKIFRDYPGQIAAVILEPVSDEKPKNKFLEKVKKIAHKHGAILIFDEMVTGFRWALGGAQEYFKVVPDLACFGKSISGGYPISIISGQSEYMRRMDEIFVSTTFGGFLPGIAAAVETIKMMREFKNVHKRIHALGERLITKANKIAKEFSVPIEFVGYGPHPVMKVNLKDDFESRIIKTLIYQEMNEMGILFNASVLVGYAHSDKDINKVLEAFRKICRIISEVRDPKKLRNLLKGEVVAPRSVRG